VSLDPAVLAKLMLLESKHFDDFQQLFDWQVASGGPSCPQLVAAEQAVLAGDGAPLQRLLQLLDRAGALRALPVLERLFAGADDLLAQLDEVSHQELALFGGAEGEPLEEAGGHDDRVPVADGGAGDDPARR
jgi:hypothetical protein